MQNMDNDGVIDIDAAAAELRGVGAMSSESLRREAIAKITAGALLDIAASLRTLGTEAALAMGEAIFADDPELTEPAAPDFLVVGDIVKRRDEDGGFLGVVTGVGVTEGELYADVSIGVDDAGGRAWQRDLERVPVAPEGSPLDVDPPAEVSDDEESDDEESDDFTPPATALDALREAEKKTTKKKGKKS